MRPTQRYCFGLAVLLMLAFGSLPVVADKHHDLSVQWHSDMVQAWERTQENDQPMLLFVTADNCGYCAMMKQRTYADNQVVSKIRGSFVPAIIDARKFHDWGGQSVVNIYPTTLIIGPDRQVIEKISGYVSAEEMQARLVSASEKIDTVKR